jgi:hypothetical protein
MEKYAPYHLMPEFERGRLDYHRGEIANPFPADSVAAQAWDRGAEAQMRAERNCSQ